MSRRAVSRALVLAAVLAAGGALAVAAARGGGGPGSIEERVDEVASGLRCPVCQSLSVADSSSQVAVEMRAEIARDLRAGKTPDEIRAEFVDAYGAWVLLEPPRSGIDLLAWLLPLGAVLAGAGTTVLLVRRWARRPRAEPSAPDGSLGPEDRAMLRRAMEEGP